MKKVFLALVALFAVATQGFAQGSKPNLLLNPGFEEDSSSESMQWKIKHWNISNNIFYMLDTSTPKEGARAVSMYVSAGGYIGQHTGSGEARLIEIGNESALTLRYWYKSALQKPNLETIIRLHTSADEYARTIDVPLPGSMIEAKAADWTEKVIEIPIATLGKGREPNGQPFTHFSIWFRVKADTRDRGMFYIDDMSLVRGGLKPVIVVDKPTGVKGDGYEHEIELSWDRSLDAEVKWRVEVEGGKTYETAVPSLILTKLEPEKVHKLKVTALKGEAASEPVELSVRTASITKDRDAEDRLPYLRTLVQGDGQTRKTLRLFYNNLYNVDAKCTYWIDGVQVTPKGDELTFPSSGKHNLRIRLEESTSDVWELNYNLQVND